MKASFKTKLLQGYVCQKLLNPTMFNQVMAGNRRGLFYFDHS